MSAGKLRAWWNFKCGNDTKSSQVTLYRDKTQKWAPLKGDGAPKLNYCRWGGRWGLHCQHEHASVSSNVSLLICVPKYKHRSPSRRQKSHQMTCEWQKGGISCCSCCMLWPLHLNKLKINVLQFRFCKTAIQRGGKAPRVVDLVKFWTNLTNFLTLFKKKSNTLQRCDTAQNHGILYRVVQRWYQHNLKSSHHRHI